MYAFIYLFPSLLFSMALVLAKYVGFDFVIFFSIIVTAILSRGIICEKFEAERNGKWLYFLLFFILALLMTAVYFLFDHGYDLKSFHSPFGSIESGRYVNISNFIILNNAIPYIKQNFGQSIFMAALHRTTGIGLYLALTMLVALAKAQLLLMFFLMLKGLKWNAVLAVLVAISILFHSVTLSVDNIIATDTGFPLGLTGYFDPVYGVVTLIIVGLILDDFISFVNKWLKFFVLLIFVFAWLVYAPQNILIFMIYSVFRIFISRSNWPLLLIAVVVIFWGRFTPGFLLLKMDLEALRTIGGLDILVNKFKLVFNPGLDVLIFNSKAYPGFIFSHINHQPIKYESIIQYFFVFIDRMVFVYKSAWLVIVSVAYFIYKLPELKFSKNLDIIFLASTSVFLGAILFEVEGMKWQMSRFAYPIYLLSLFWIYGFAIKGRAMLLIPGAFVFPNLYDFLVRFCYFMANKPIDLFGLLYRIN